MLDAGLSTLEYLKARLLPEASREDTTWDLALSNLGIAIAERMERNCARRFAWQENAVDEFTAFTVAMTLRRYPVAELVSIELKLTLGSLTPFTGAASLDAEAGTLEFVSPPGSRSQRLVITYKGGYWLGDEDAPEGATKLPADLLEIWISEVQLQAAARRLFEAVALSAPQTGNNDVTTNGLSEGCIQALRPYLRLAGA